MQHVSWSPVYNNNNQFVHFSKFSQKASNNDANSIMRTTKLVYKHTVKKNQKHYNITCSCSSYNVLVCDLKSGCELFVRFVFAGIEI